MRVEYTDHGVTERIPVSTNAQANAVVRDLIELGIDPRSIVVVTPPISVGGIPFKLED